MDLTPEQLKIIREATIDEEAFHRVVSLIKDSPQSHVDMSPFALLNLDSTQINLFTAITSTIQSVIFMKDLDSRFIMANQACLQMNHCTVEEEILGKSDFDFMPAEAAQIHFDIEQEILSTGIPLTDVENHFINLDNEPKWYLESKFPIYDQEGNIVGLVGILSDITPQKLAEKALEHERNLLKTIIDHIDEEIYIKDRDSRFILANAATIRSHQTTGEDIVGTTDFDYQQCSLAQAFFDEEQTIMATGVPISGQEVSASSSIDGSFEDWYLVSKMPVYDENGVITGLVGINRDITLQKLSEQTLKNERNLLQTLIDHVKDRIYIKDRESRFIGANAATLKDHKVSLQELIGSSDFDYLPAEVAQTLFDEEQEIMATGQAIINKELIIPAEITNDTPLWYLVSKVPMYDEHGDISGLVGVNNNITDIKLAEQKALQLQLEQERSKILVDFITNSSHEFRTPISVINTAVYMLERIDDPEKRQKYAERITNNTALLLNLLDSLLLMSRIDQIRDIEKESLTLGRLLHDVEDQFQSKLTEKDQILHLNIDTPRLIIEGNPELLIIALSAILENALRYSPDQSEILIHGYEQDDKTIINIQDRGIGMTDQTKARIFERFFREDQAHSTGGFGLGLPIALQIIELHSGQIKVESELNKGSQFMIILPQASPEPIP